MEKENKDKFLIVAGIDFGTSNSGIAFGFTSECNEGKPGKVHHVQWNAGVGATRATTKVPTAALFNKNMDLQAFGHEAEEQYAALAENKEHTDWHLFRRFKLELHGKIQLKRKFEIEDSSGQSFPAHEIFTASIRYLKNKLIETLKDKNPMTSLNQQQDYDNIIKWVITVPAIWNEPAKQFMREAAVEAGILTNNLSFALEPEAAAVFCKHLPDSTQKGSEDEDIKKGFAPGGKYMILDLGGGTADIAVHQVAEDGTLTEIIQASGGPWGGCVVNKLFFSYIDELFGEEQVRKYSDSHASDWLELDHEFEEQKKRLTYHSKVDEKVRIKMPARLVVESELEIKNIQSYNKLLLAIEKLKYFYDEIIQKIVSQVKQVLSKVDDQDLLLMVGGLSNSNYVLGVMQKEFPKIRIIRPLLAETAVLEGAVMFGFFPATVSSRVCRFNYGIQMVVLFQEGVHLEEYRTLIDGEVRCTHQFKLMIEDGAVMKINESREFKDLCSSHKDPGRKFINMFVPVFASTIKEPKYTTDECCTLLGKIIVHAPPNGWPERVQYRVEIYFGRTEFEVKVFNNSDDSEFKATYDFLH